MLGQNQAFIQWGDLADLGRSVLRPYTHYQRGQTPAVKLRMVVKCRFS
jgi:hypothetical protein